MQSEQGTLAGRFSCTLDKSVSNRTGRIEWSPRQLHCDRPRTHGPLEHNLLASRRTANSRRAPNCSPRIPIRWLNENSAKPQRTTTRDVPSF